MRICIIGAGFVGITTATTLAELGHEVLIVENSIEKIEQLSTGILPFFEPDLESAFFAQVERNNLAFSDWENLVTLDEFNFYLICVGTPKLADGSADLGQVENALNKLKDLVTKRSVIVLRSTVPPGTTRELELSIVNTKNFNLIFQPEFLREGSALSDSRNPDRIVVGGSSKFALDSYLEIYSSLECRIIKTTSYSAECIKYLNNIFLSLCISFSNEFFGAIETDYDYEMEKILSGWHSDRRFNTKSGGSASIISYLLPGIGFGGSCFPKDTAAFINAFSSPIYNELKLINHILDVNVNRIKIISDWMINNFESQTHFIICGITFKEFSSDTRNSKSIELLEELKRIKDRVTWIDPLLSPKTFEEDYGKLFCAEDSIFVLTNHDPYYRQLIMKTYELKKKQVKVIALRGQALIENTIWIVPRRTNFAMENL